MIQSEIINGTDEKTFIEDLNYFLDKLEDHQFIDIKFRSNLYKNKLFYQALIIYKTE